MKSKVKDLPINNPPDEEIIPLEEIQPIIPKKQVSEQQLMNLAKARERAKERKKELAELNSKSKGLKEEQLRKDAEEYDRLKEEKKLKQQEAEKKIKQKELEEAIKKVESEKEVKPEKQHSSFKSHGDEKPKKKVKKIIYESDDDEEEEEVIIKKKRAPKQPSYSDLADMSVEKQIKDKLQQEKITCFFNQLTGKKH